MSLATVSPILPGTPEQALDAIQNLFPPETTDVNWPAFVGTMTALFRGQHPDYEPCDLPYHDLTHTCEVVIATVRLLQAHFHQGESPSLTTRQAGRALAAAWLHDSGYLKDRGDRVGTGAKHTATHVARGLRVAAVVLPVLGFAGHEITAVQNMICATGLNADLSRIPFADTVEHYLGQLLGTADILAQMAADAYPHRLPGLYRELAEAGLAAAQFADAADLLRKTPTLYTDQVRRQLDQQLGGLWRRLATPYPAAIERNLQLIISRTSRIAR